MQIILIETEDSDGLARHDLHIDGTEIYIGPLCECPEDAIIGRDLIDGNDIIKYIQLGYEAGKKGEELKIEYN